MALTKSVLKMVETETVVKVAGAGGTATINIQTDLLDSNQVATGIPTGDLEDLQTVYEESVIILGDQLAAESATPGYPFGATLPVSYLTYDQFIQYNGSIPSVLVTTANSVKNNWLNWQQSLATASKVTITGIRWNGELGNVILITRNGTRVLTLPTESADYIAFDGQEMPPENTAATSDIVVTQVGTGQIEVYLKLRKVSGYAPKVETTQFSVYDNPNVVGS